MSFSKKLLACANVFVLLFCMMPVMMSSISAAPPTPNEHTVTLYAGESAFVDESQPTKNFESGSTKSYLRVWTDEFEYHIDTLIYFDFSILPEGADIVAASLKCYLVSTPTDASVHLWRLDGSWDESDVTWENHPGLDTLGYMGAEEMESSGWQEWECRSMVSDWVDGSKINYGMGLRCNQMYSHEFFSDDAAYYQPCLVVTYEGEEVEEPEPPSPEPTDTTPCSYTYELLPDPAASGDEVTLTVTATDDTAMEYVSIQKAGVEVAVCTATTENQTSLECSYSEVLYAPGEYFSIIADDEGPEPAVGETIFVPVTGTGIPPEITIEVAYRDSDAIPATHSLLPGDNQKINITVTVVDDEGIDYLTITANGNVTTLSFDPPYTHLVHTHQVENSDPFLSEFRISAAAEDIEGNYASESLEPIEIGTPFQWYWGLNFSNWGCDENHTWSWDMMEVIFGDEIWLNKDRGWRFAWAQDLFDAKIKRGGRNGHCFGMCALALELADPSADIYANLLESTAVSIDDLSREEWNYTWRYYYARQAGQYSDEVVPSRVEQYLDLYVHYAGVSYLGIHPYLEDIIDEIESDLEAGTPGILAIQEGGVGGHAVIPWRILPGDDTEETRVYVYDPNRRSASIAGNVDYGSFNTYPFVVCNTEGDMGDGWWSYAFNSTSTWDGNIYYFSYSDVIGDEGEMNHLGSVEISDHDLPGGISYLVAISSVDGSFYAMDEDGSKTGLLNGSLISEIPDAVPIVDEELFGVGSAPLLLLPSDGSYDFFWETELEEEQTNLGLYVDGEGVAIRNKTAKKGNTESVSFDAGDVQSPPLLSVSGVGDDDYQVVFSKRNELRGGEAFREYWLEKNGFTTFESCIFSLNAQGSAVIVENVGDEDAYFTVRFRSDEGLENAVVDEVPETSDVVIVTAGEKGSFAPESWSIVDDSGEVVTVSEEGPSSESTQTPGFEVVLLIGCVFMVWVLRRRNV